MRTGKYLLAVMLAVLLGLTSCCWLGEPDLGPLLAERHLGGGEAAFSVQGAFLQRPDGTVYAADVSSRPGEEPGQYVFPWGSLAVKHDTRTSSSGLHTMTKADLWVRVDEDADTLVALYLQVGEVKFPKAPKFTNHSFFFYGRTNMAHNIGAPGIVAADYGDSMLVLCNDQVGRPLSFGFGEPTDKEKLTYPLLAFTGRHPMLKEKWPFIDRPVPPGGIDHWQLSIHSLPGGGDPDKWCSGLYDRYAAAYPSKLEWEDRRAIGRLFLASAHQKLEDNYPANPRGWFNDKQIDVTTPEGLRAFHERLLKWADGAVKICTDMNAQGVILWDPEGQEYPHMISYLGDPRSLPPEMEAKVERKKDDGTVEEVPVIDEFFRRFRDAGLRTGVCIRPQRPVRTAYGDGVFQLGLVDRRACLNNLSSKIDVARKRWGCTLFYLDSNVAWYGDPVKIPDAGGYTALVDDQLLKELTEKYPDILIVPEWETLRTYAYTAPYSQLNYNKLLAPPAEVLRAYPEAFLVNCPDKKSVEPAKDALVKSVARGDILFFSGWWRSGENPIVKEVYEQAAK